MKKGLKVFTCALAAAFLISAATLSTACSDNDGAEQPPEEEPLVGFENSRINAVMHEFYGKAMLSENATLKMTAEYATDESEISYGDTQVNVKETHDIVYLKDGDNFYGDNVRSCEYMQSGMSQSVRYSVGTYLRDDNLYTLNGVNALSTDENQVWLVTNRAADLAEEFWNSEDRELYDPDTGRRFQPSAISFINYAAGVFVQAAEYDSDPTEFIEQLNFALSYFVLFPGYGSHAIYADGIELSLKCEKNDTHLKVELRLNASYEMRYGDETQLERDTLFTLTFDLNTCADNKATDFSASPLGVPQEWLRYIDVDGDYSAFPQLIRSGSPLNFNMKGGGDIVWNYYPDDPSLDVGTLRIFGSYDGKEIKLDTGSGEIAGATIILYNPENADSFTVTDYSSQIAECLTGFEIIESAEQYDPSKLDISRLAVEGDIYTVKSLPDWFDSVSRLVYYCQYYAYIYF